MLADIFQTAANAVPYIATAIAAVAVLKGSLYTVPQEHEALVTRFGKHNRTNTEAGLKMKIPFIEQVHRISHQEFQEVEELETKTTDNLFVKLPISIHYQVNDSATFKFKKGNPIDLMKKVVAASVRKYTSGKDFQELYDERQEVRDDVIAETKSQVAGYGIQINDIVIDEPQASSEVKKTFDRVRSSALEKDAATNEAEADYIRTVKRAEADKQRNILIGEGVAGFREKVASNYTALRKQLVADGVDPAAADRFMEEAMRLDTLRDIGDKGNMVIVAPDSSSGQRLAELQTLGQTLPRSPASEQDVSPKGPEARMAAGPV